MSFHDLMQLLGELYYQHGDFAVLVDGKKFTVEVRDGTITFRTL